MKKINIISTTIFLMTILLNTLSITGQSTASYTSVRNTGVSYTSISLTGSSFASWRNTTSNTQDDNRSDFTDIGFDFWYNGVRYTQFSISTNGYLDFSSSTSNGNSSGAFGYVNSAFTTNGASTNPAIAAFYDDLTAQGGTGALGNSMKYALSGAAPNRTLTIEWINMAVFGNTLPDLNFQVQLVETTGVIFVTYSTMTSGGFTFSYSMGLNGQTISAPPTAAQLKALQVGNTNTFSNTAVNTLTLLPTANSQYVFTPPVPTTAAGSLTLSAITQTGMTVSWPNWASNEVGYVIYNSTDNTTFNFNSQAAANATTSAISGLSPGTTYYWKVYAVTEGCLSAALTGSASTLAAGTKTSAATGSWSTAATWTPSGVPTSANNVVIADGHTVTVDVNAFCNNLTIGQGTSGVLLIGNNATARTMSVSGSCTVSAGAAIRTNTASAATHSLILLDQVVNNGTINLAAGASNLCNVTFSKNGNQTISGSGSTTTFNRITLNMGTSVSNILDIQTSSFVAPSNFLTLTNGTFKLSTTGASNITTFSVATTIPLKGSIWLNSAPSTINVTSNITLAGNITISNGIFNNGLLTDVDLISNGGSIAISNGTLNIAGKYYSSSINNISNFTISGGKVIVPSVSSTNTTIAPFQINGAGSIFNMSAGTLIIPREGGTGAQDLGFINTGTSGGSVTGGTLQIGSSASPVSQTIQINSSYSVGTLLISSANVNASVVTNSLSVIGDVTISSGTLSAGSQTLSLGGNWSNSGSFTQGTSSVLFNGTGAQTILKTGGETFNNISFSNAGAKTLLSAITCKDFLINTSSNLDVTASNFSIAVSGNLTNNGTFNTRSGTILLNGTTTQTVGGTTATDFYDLTLDNTSGAGLSSAQRLINTLTLTNGAFNTNGNAFTMVSTSTNTARVAQIAATASIAGNVTVQRYAPSGKTGWALIGTPISSALTFQDWDDNIGISCASCPDGSAGGFTSIYSYDETAAGVQNSAASYVAISAITDPITPNKGYWVYLGTGSGTTTAITIDVAGTLRQQAQAIPLTMTAVNTPTNDGWNLIHNPYPSPISWSSIYAAGTNSVNLDNAIYAYNADVSGGIVSYVNSVSSPSVEAGGIGDVIPMCQGFFVHTTATKTLNITEANKIAGNPTFLKTNNTTAATPLIRLYLDGPSNRRDETVIYSQAGATNNFDPLYDALKLSGQNPKAPSISLDNGINFFSINGVDISASNFSMPLKTTTGYNGTYTISLANFNSFPLGACFTLLDRYNNTTTDLTKSNYVFTLLDTTKKSRFILTITSNSLNITSTLSQPSCYSSITGEIIAKGTSVGPWDYQWKDNNGVILKSSINKTTEDTLKNLIGGNYSLEVHTVGLCDNNTTQFTINTVDLSVAQFTCVDTTYYSNGGLVVFTNNSTNAISSTWDFGDSNGTSNTTNPTYNYPSKGTYTVSLITQSSSGCLDTTIKKVVVINDAVNFQIINNTKGLILKTLSDNEFIISGDYTDSDKIQLSIIDIQGRNIMDLGLLNSKNLRIPIDLSNLKVGLYYLEVSDGKSKVLFKLPVR